MKTGLNIAPLRCKKCGSELPVRGQFITFQCPTCRKHWLLGDNGLEPLHVERAVDRETRGETVFLPFWVVPIDLYSLIGDIKNQMEESSKRVSGTIEELKEDTSRPESPAWEIISANNPTGERLFSKKGEFMAHIVSEKVSVGRSELNRLIFELSSRKDFRVFVPAFLSCNPYAYIKVGRLMTEHQITFESRESLSESMILCSLKKASAVEIVDFIFISTLPEKLRTAGRFVERLHLKPSGQPLLVEFPFEVEGNYLTSIHGAFSLSRRLISIPDEKITV